MALEASLAENRDKIIRFINKAKSQSCRLAVFPEAALTGPPETEVSEISDAVSSIKQAADELDIYVMFGCARTKKAEGGRALFAGNWMLVIDPEGREVLNYKKLFDVPTAKMPDPFYVDGVPCSAMICADRWLRGVEELPVMKGAKVVFELSHNHDTEWVSELQWYWYVPRAIRNSTYVVFANTADPLQTSGRPAYLYPAHGHSTVIQPDGTRLLAAGGEPDQLLVANIDVSKASRQQAVTRRNNTAFKPFWESGLRLMGGESLEVETFKPFVSPEVNVRLAAAQMASSRSPAENLARMQSMIRTARSKGADVVVFPELAVTGALDEDIAKADQALSDKALRSVQRSAIAERIYVIFGMPYLVDGKKRNSAFVIGPDGKLLTRYDQLAVDRPQLFNAGSSPGSMWFRIKGVPSIVSIGEDAVWSELAELAAVAGAQMHFHISYDQDISEEGKLRRTQLWANLASYRTLTLTVNAAAPAKLNHPSAKANGESAIWGDVVVQREKTRSDIDLFSPFSADRLIKAGFDEEIIYATERVSKENPHVQLLRSKNPQMANWYTLGARIMVDGAMGSKSSEAHPSLSH
ncbi:MAG: carbon-nitrogen hydrolase family protein [Acidobacteria bacterium]|nr:carbon-nitrogen hydrolase family protein [Acidobacteriota bacterium]MCI0724456.1 carbon-nitrogen hydrolase family protein [Acidobacteriota bacterium]